MPEQPLIPPHSDPDWFFDFFEALCNRPGEVIIELNNIRSERLDKCAQDSIEGRD